jgi:hypothetical protein
MLMPAAYLPAYLLPNRNGRAMPFAMCYTYPIWWWSSPLFWFMLGTMAVVRHIPLYTHFSIGNRLNQCFLELALSRSAVSPRQAAWLRVLHARKDYVLV